MSVCVSPTLFNKVFAMLSRCVEKLETLFLSTTYLVLIEAGVRHLFILIPHLYNHELTAEHPQEKISNPREKCWTHEIPTR